LPSLGGTSTFTRWLRSAADECAAAAWSWSPGSSGRDMRRGDGRISQSSWRTPIVRLRMFHTDAGRTAGTRPLQCRGVALGHRTAKAPAWGLSTLHSMASGLAVYASPGGLPHRGAKLASSRWSDATGRAFHPQGPNRRFQSAFVISSSFSKLAWRNRCVFRRLGEPRCARR
jgi:hypothetical protein